jgi:hypothetical protein
MPSEILQLWRKNDKRGGEVLKNHAYESFVATKYFTNSACGLFDIG